MVAYFYLFSILFITFICLILFININDTNKMSDRIKNFESYAAVLEYHMKKCYDIIYKDKILIYSLEAVKINDEEFNNASKEFALLVLKIIGPNLKNEFIELYGDEETLIFNLIEYFNTNFENDEIREKSRQNMFDKMDDDIKT
jgi:hypothetical protein